MKSYIRAVFGREKGFTLVELLIVIAIIAILTVAFLPGALKAPAKARDAQRQKAVYDISAALESYIAEHNGTIPASDATNCFLSTNIAAGNFNPLPVDPRPQGTGSCVAAVAANNNKYFYRATATFYVIAALVEVRGSGNTCAAYLAANSTAANCAGAATVGLSDTATLAALNASIGTSTPDAETPYFAVFGPTNI